MSNNQRTVPAPEATVPKHRPQRVLVAEDDREMMSVLVKTLSSDGYEVEQAGSGLELFDSLRTSRGNDDLPDLVVSDVRMPGLSGLQVLQALASWGLSLPVLLITAFPDEETLAEADRAGAVAVLSKPFDMDDLRTAVAYLLQHPERADALRRPPTQAPPATHP